MLCTQRQASYHLKALECKNMRAFDLSQLLNKTVFNVTLKTQSRNSKVKRQFCQELKNSNARRFKSFRESNSVQKF